MIRWMLGVSAGSHGFGEAFEEVLGGLPADALVGDGLTVGEFVEVALEFLAAFDKVAFDHDGGEGFVSAGDLFAE